MKIWQKVLDGKIQDSTTIKTEIQTLTSSGRAMEETLPGLEKSLSEARKALFAEVPGSLERVKQVESAISENTGKIAAIASILQDLDAVLQTVLVNEKQKRQNEIRAEVAEIDRVSKEKRLELVKAYAQACALYREITGQEFYNLNYRFFENYDLTGLLQERIQEIAPAEISLYQKREKLQREGERLRKQLIS